MSDEPVVNTTSEPGTSATPVGPVLSNNARYKRRKRLYARHRKYHPYDETYELLKIPDYLQKTRHNRARRTGERPTTIYENPASTGEILFTENDEHSEVHPEQVQEDKRVNEEEQSEQSMAINDGSNSSSADDSVEVDPRRYDCHSGASRENSGVRNDGDDISDNSYETEEEEGREESSSEDHNCIDNHWEIDASEGEKEKDEDTDTPEEDDEFDEINEETSTPLKFRSFVTNIVVILCLLATAIRSNMTYATLLGLFKTIKKLTVGSRLPCYMKKFMSIFSKNDKNPCTRHFYCRKCMSNLGAGAKPQQDCICGECGPNKSNKSLAYFIEMKIIPQLRQLFSDAAIVNSLGNKLIRRKKSDGTIEDIYDAKEYQKLSEPGGFLSYEYNFSFGIFTDGCKVAESSKASAWPIMLLIHEFSPHARKKYMILAGIWVDTLHPDLNRILEPTITELNFLYNTGIVWKHPINGIEIRSKFTTLVCTVDSVARHELLNMTRFNGEYGCTFCYSKGAKLKNVRGQVYPVEREPAASRADQEIRESMRVANDTNERVKGVRGYSVMALLNGFNLASGVVVDSMHNVFLGVAKLHTTLLLQKNPTVGRYPSKSEKMDIIDSRLLKIRPPTRIARTPRSIRDMKKWKASEWRNWLQFYALLCLNGIIDDADLGHFALLSRAAYILNTDCISIPDLAVARELLEKYVRAFEERFGKRNMRYNVHLLNHLTDSVENWGPFWTHSAFPYESWNKKIIDKVTSPNSRCLQIIARYMLTRFIERQFNNPRITNKTKNIMNSILTDGLKKKDYVIDSTPLIQPAFQGIKKITDLSPNNRQSSAFRIAGYDPPRSFTSFQRAIINGTDVTCRRKDKTKEANYCNRYIYCEALHGYGEIVKIIDFRDTNDSVVSGLLVEKLNAYGKYFGVEHIDTVGPTTDFVFVAANGNLTITPAVFMDTPGNTLCISALPNVWETD